MTDRTYSEDDVQRIVDQALARQQEALARQQVANADPRRAELALARVTRDNNVLDRVKLQRMSADERRHHVRDQDLVREAMADIQPILDARDAVERAREGKTPIDPATLALAREDPTRFDTVEIECMAEQAHVGDGRKIYRGDIVKCHPALAELLAGRGVVRMIEDSNDISEARSAVVRPIR